MVDSKQSWRIVKKQPLLEAVIDELAGSAHISFEGDLARTRLLDFKDSSTIETDVLRRNTIWPKQDFIVIPLEQGNRDQIWPAIGGTIPRSVLHILVEKRGTLEFGMYDGWQHLFLGPALANDFAMRLQTQGILARI